MGKQGAIRAGRAYVELFADNSPLIRGLGIAKAKLTDWGRSVQRIGLKVMAAGSALAAPLIFSVKHFMNFGHKMEEMSVRTGIGVEALSELTYAAERSGVETETLGAALRGMNNTIGEAAAGSKPAIKNLAALGLSVQDLLKLSPEDRFMVIADRLNRIGDVSMRTAAAMDVLKRSGAAILPMLQDLPGVRQHARALGLTISSSDARAASQLHDMMFDLWRVIKMVAFVTGAALAPRLKDLAARASVLLVRGTQGLRQNQGLVVSVAKLAVGLIGAGAALVALGIALKTGGMLAGILSTVLHVVGAALGLLLSPVGLVVAGIVALAAVLIFTTETGHRFLGWLGDNFKVLGQIAGDTFQGIKDALAAGDIRLAAKVLWTGLKLVWLEGTQGLRVAWANFMYNLRVGFEEMTADLTAAFLDFTLGMKTIWIEFSSWWRRTQSDLALGITVAWLNIQGILDDTLDVEFAVQQAAAHAAAEMMNLTSERKAALEAALAASNEALRSAEATHQRKLAQIREEGEASVKAAREAAGKAREEWEDARALAAQEAYFAGRNAPGQPGAPRIPTMPDLAQQLKGATVAGTFQATALWGLGAGSSIDRIAKATEQTAENTEETAEAVKNSGAEFTY